MSGEAVLSEPQSPGQTKYKTVLADPPWNETGAGQIKRGADRHYSLMKTDEIIAYMKTVPFDENCHLYLWVTNNHLPDGLKVIEALGFQYITNIVWVKDRDGLGQYFRGRHELCLFARKGQPPFKNSLNSTRSVCTESSAIFAKRTEHSRKPDEMYFKIEATSYAPFLELFARRRRQGWDAWGDQLDPVVQMNLIPSPEPEEPAPGESNVTQDPI